MSEQATLYTRLSAVCGENVSFMAPIHTDEILFTIPQDQLLSILSVLRQEFGIVFVDLFGLDLRVQRGIFQLHLICALDAEHAWLHLVVDIDGQTATFPSLGDLFPATGWYERVIWEELGIVPQHHPLLRPLRLAPDWPERVRPAQEGFTWGARAPAGEPRFFELEDAPSGVVDYPLGPVRSGIVESGHYLLRTVGEELVDIFVQPFYKHRGIEQRAEEVPIELVPLLAERISGTSSFAHSLAFCQACERLAGAQVPKRARVLRTLFAELERLYNHLGYQADLCQATGLSVAQAQFDIWKERVLRLNAHISGHRYLFGMNIPGGLSRDLTTDGQEAVRELVSALLQEMVRLGRQLLASSSHRDRLEHTGVLAPEQAREYCAVGPVGRASGRNRYLRRDHPYAAYAEMDMEIPVRQEGDALARARVCLDEIEQALCLIEQALAQLREGATVAQLPPLPAGGSALGWAESARGECLHWILVGEDGRLQRYRVRTASFANWQAFSLAIPGHNILTDFPVIEQSFGLSFAGANG
jgi:Ni,Fe-hydrogenase III large subunit/Ni,Fe-hydrogenase III component G